MTEEKFEITEDEFRHWRHENPVTERFFDEMIDLMNDIAASLVRNAGLNPIDDRYLSGRISGLAELADWKPQFVRETNE